MDRNRLLLGVGFSLAGVTAVTSAIVIAHHFATPPKPLLPPLSTEATVTRPAPNLVLAIRDLQRLESAEMHMERVMDMRSTQTHLFGLATAEDALLLVAVGDVVAGVDLSKLEEGDVRVDWANKRVTVELPGAEILSSRLDSEKTHVHSRKVDLLADRKESLESEARASAEKEIEKAAKDAGILDRAGKNSARTIEGLARSLGFEHVEVRVRAPRS